MEHVGVIIQSAPGLTSQTEVIAPTSLPLLMKTSIKIATKQSDSIPGLDQDDAVVPGLVSSGPYHGACECHNQARLASHHDLK